jgi:1-deoxy-D-xylulose-5-phosphate reductoisomerase
VHPESIVHSLINLNDGASIAHLGLPDMRVPISYALHFPERADVSVPTLDLAATRKLTFEEPDLETFRSLALARGAGEAGGTSPCVLNAANEVAVHAFLDRRLSFVDIPRVIERALEAHDSRPLTRFEDLYEADGEARARASLLVEELAVEA